MIEQATLTNVESMEIGTQDEKEQANTLHKNGYTVESATKQEDIYEGIDRFLKMADGTREPLQIKGRDPNPEKAHIFKDLGSDEYEPYCGLDHPDTVVGRDGRSKYKWFTCRIADSMYLVSGTAHKALIADVLAEFRTSKNRTEIDSRLATWINTLQRNSNGKIDWQPNTKLFDELKQFTFKSQQHPGDNGKKIEVKCIQEKRKTDWQKNRPKLLVYVPPSCFNAKQAKLFKIVKIDD
jgi:hypothetical protein